jgi:hypothetical protein
MSPAETEEFLGRCGHAVVAVRGADGFPCAAVAGLSYDAGAATLTLHADDDVVAALADGEEACCVADEWPSYEGIKGVIAHGTAVAVDRRGSVATVGIGFDRMTTFDFAHRL